MNEILILELASKGYSCAQIVVMVGLRYMDKENPDLVRALSALEQGGACSGATCGALTGGLCLISLYSAKGTDFELKLESNQLMLEELLDWFNAKYEQKTTCDMLLESLSSQASKDMSACGALVASVLEKCLEILIAHGIDLRSSRDDQ